MKNLLLFIVFTWEMVMYISLLHGQQVFRGKDEDAYLKELQQIIDTARDDSTVINNYFLLSDYWRFKDTVRSRQYLQQGKEIMKKKKMMQAANHVHLQALYYFYEGQFYYNWNQELAADYYLRSAEIVEKIHNAAAYKLAAAAWSNYGIMKREKMGDEYLTQILMNKSIPIIEKARDGHMAAQYYNMLGSVLMSNEQYQDAEQYFDKAISSILNDPAEKSSNLLPLVYISGADNLYYSKKYTEAEAFLAKAKEELDFSKESINISYYYYLKGSLDMVAERMDEARNNLEKGLELTQKFNQHPLSQMIQFRLYEFYKRKGEYSTAKKLIDDIYQKGIYTQETKQRKQLYYELSEISRLSGNIPEAYQWLRSYSQLSDSMYEEQVKIKINELEESYQNVQKEKRIYQLSAEKKQAVLSSQNRQLWIWALGISCGLILTIAFSIYNNYRKNKQLLIEKEINHRQELGKLAQTQQFAFTQAILQGEENERRRLAQDLHDGLGGMLAGVKINLSGSLRNDKNYLEPQELHKILYQLDNSVAELRRIAHNMMPVNLIKFGLETALRDLCESLINDRIGITFQALNISKQINEQTQINIYRIIQELLHNAIKHAQAGQIILQCSQNEDRFYITIEDDGIGFDASRHQDGIGLENIKNRVGFLKGTMEVESHPNEGTIINIEVNVSEQD